MCVVHDIVYMHTVCISRDFIFANFANQRAIVKIKMRKCVRIRYKFAAVGRHLQNQNRENC